MDPISLGSGLFAFAVSGVAVGAGMRLLPIGLQAHRDFRKWPKSRAATSKYRKVSRHKRESSIIGFSGDWLRNSDGSYTCGYELQLQPTMLASDEVVDRDFDALGGMLAAECPKGTLIQFRYEVGPDPGRAIEEHRRARASRDVHDECVRIHEQNLNFTKAKVRNRIFRQDRLFLFVRVPTHHRNDHLSMGMNAFLSDLVSDYRTNGFKGLGRAASRHWNDTHDGVVRRIVKEEEEMCRQAEKVARQIQMQCPFSLRRLNRDQLWNVVYSSHVKSAPSSPVLPRAEAFDVKDFLCAESISDCGWYVLHGNTPATIISVFRPGEGFIAADAMRALTAHPGLSFKHEIITEYIRIDPAKARSMLDSRIKHVERSATLASGGQKLTPEADESLRDLVQTRHGITGSREALMMMRQFVVIYGDPVRTRNELERSLKQLDINADTIVNALHSLPGVQAGREEPGALHCLYPGTLIGEASNEKNGRELIEVAHSLAVFIPTETAWGGSHRPHTLLVTASGRLVGLNLWDKTRHTNIKSPVVLIIGEPGAGKTICGVRIVNDALATIPNLRVHALDYGGSLAPHALVTGASYHTFNPADPKAINIWEIADLSHGKHLQLSRLTNQISLIVMDAVRMAGANDSVAADLLTKAVREVLKNFASRNRSGRPRREPTHADLVEMLDAYDFGSEDQNRRARELSLTLDKYVGDPWLDAPTHPDFKSDAKYHVYELDSLNAFQPELKQILANRIGARVIRSIGEKQPDGTRAPTMVLFDELHEYRENFPGLLPVLKRGTRHGRKHNVVTVMMSHTFDDFEGMHDVTSTAGVKLIGRQTGDLSSLINAAKLSPRTVQAINALRNRDGQFTQWALVLGSGDSQQVETVENHLSPTMLWVFTTNPEETNARARVAALRPEWTVAQGITWLAAKYPQGLASSGMVFDESLLAGEPMQL